MLVIALAICTFVGATVSVLTYLHSQNKIKEFESNCIATLKSKVSELEKDRDRHRVDLDKIFGRLDVMNREIGEVKTMVNKLNNKG